MGDDEQLVGRESQFCGAMSGVRRPLDKQVVMTGRQWKLQSGVQPKRSRLESHICI